MNNLDLNLLRVFDAVMSERSVLRAGQRIGLSQSAVSHALSRLRWFMQDDLFVRTAQRMEPTSRANEMAPLVRDALMALERAVSASAFDSANSTRKFHVAATDYITTVIGPLLLQDLAENAPGIDLVILPATRIDLATQIDLGRIDVAIGNFSTIPPRLHSSVLLEDNDVLVMSGCHPLVGTDVTIDAVAHFSLMAVAVGGVEDGLADGFVSERGLSRRSEMFDRVAIEGAFAERGLELRISVLIPHFLAIPSLVVGSERIALMPALLAEAFRSSLGIAVLPTPWPVNASAVQMVWHERSERSPAHQWLRQRFYAAASAARQAGWVELEEGRQGRGRSEGGDPSPLSAADGGTRA